MSMLHVALQMELDGEQYYLKQAGLNKENAMNRAFQLLADAEKQHARLLRSKLTGEDNKWAEELLSAGSVNLFTNKADFKRSAEVLPGQLEVYVVALEMEQKSIDLYQEMLNEAKDEKTVQFLQFLLDQEHEHFNLFDELTTLLRRPRDWVENAEFGPRIDY